LRSARQAPVLPREPQPSAPCRLTFNAEI